MFDACVSAASTLANSPHPAGMSLQHISIISPVVLAGQASHILEAAIDVPSGSMQLASVGSKHAPKPAPAQLHCSCTVAKVEQASAVAGQSTAPPASGMSAGRYCMASGLRCATHYPRQLVQLPAVGCIAVPGSAQLSGHSMHPGRSDAVLHLSAAWLITAGPLQIPVGLSALAVQGAESGKGCGWIYPIAAPASNGGTAAGPVFDFCLKEEQQALFHASCLEVREVRGAALASSSTAAQLASLDSLVYEVQWQVASQHRMSPLSRRQATTRENHAGAWSVVHDGHVGSMCSAPDSALHCFAAGIRNAAGVTGVVTNGLELLQQRLAGSCTLQIVASAGTVPSLTGAGSAMPAAASASLEALAKVAAAEGGSDVLCSGRVDDAAPVAAAIPAVDPFGTAAVGGSLLQAKLLRHPLRVLPANSHLLPVPRGSLANLKLEMHASEIPAPGTVKVRAADGICYMPSTWANSTGLLLSCLPLLTTHCSCVCARWVSTSVMC